MSDATFNLQDQWKPKNLESPSLDEKNFLQNQFAIDSKSSSDKLSTLTNNIPILVSHKEIKHVKEIGSFEKIFAMNEILRENCDVS